MTYLYVLLIIFTQNVWAFKLNLTDHILDVGDGEFSTTASIINDGSNMIAIEASARVRSYSIDGIENIDTFAEDLIIIPNQMIIPPEGEQIINIRWTGSRNISTEKAYRLLVEYVSVSEDKLKGQTPQKKEAGININYRIAKSFYVTPKGAQPKLIVQEVKKSSVSGKDHLLLTIDNKGSEHQIVHSLDLQVATQLGEKIKVSITKEDIGGSGINFLPNEKRNIPFPLPDTLLNKDVVSVEIIGFTE